MEVSRTEEETLRAQVPINGIFKHYKGNSYKVLAFARSSEDLQLWVVYQPLSESKELGDQGLWIRPLKFFVETVVVNGQEVPRFCLVSERPLD
jgi:hypothetical protein